MSQLCEARYGVQVYLSRSGCDQLDIGVLVANRNVRLNWTPCKRIIRDLERCKSP